MESLDFKIEFEAMATRFKHKKHLDLAPVDLLWVSAESFTKMATTGQKTGHHCDIPVVDFEALLAMKLHALKDDKERKGKDILDIDLPDFSGHPPPPKMTLEQYEKWVLEMYAKSKYPTMSREEMLEEWMRNEGSQTEEWPDFGACSGDASVLKAFP